MNKHTLILAATFVCSLYGAHHPVVTGGQPSTPASGVGTQPHDVIDIDYNSLFRLAKAGRFKQIEDTIKIQQADLSERPELLKKVLNAQDSDGNTIVHLVVLEKLVQPAKRLATFKFLLELLDVDVTIKNNAGHTVDDLVQGKPEFQQLLTTRAARQTKSPGKDSVQPVVHAASSISSGASSVPIKSSKQAASEDDDGDDSIPVMTLKSKKPRGDDTNSVRAPMPAQTVPAMHPWDLFRQTNPETAAFVQALQSYETGDPDILKTTLSVSTSAPAINLMYTYEPAFMPNFTTTIRPNSMLFEVFDQIHETVLKKYPQSGRVIEFFYGRYVEVFHPELYLHYVTNSEPKNPQKDHSAKGGSSTDRSLPEFTHWTVRWADFAQRHPASAAFVQALQSYEGGNTDIIRTTFQPGINFMLRYDQTFMQGLTTAIKPNSTILEAFCQVHVAVTIKYPRAAEIVRDAFQHYVTTSLDDLQKVLVISLLEQYSRPTSSSAASSTSALSVAPVVAAPVAGTPISVAVTPGPSSPLPVTLAPHQPQLPVIPTPVVPQSVPVAVPSVSPLVPAQPLPPLPPIALASMPTKQRASFFTPTKIAVGFGILSLIVIGKLYYDKNKSRQTSN